MKLAHLLVGGLALASGTVFAQVIPAVSVGTPYERVRAELVRTGWKPVRQTESCGMVCEGHRRAGWPETLDCADTGLAPCVFVFRHGSGKALEVVTRGEAPRFNGFR
jgi:hypothetical protein